MIILEALKYLGWWTVRGVYWLITARDCEHCCYGRDHCTYYCCGCPNLDDMKQCTKTIRRIYFKRKRRNHDGWLE